VREMNKETKKFNSRKDLKGYRGQGGIDGIRRLEQWERQDEKGEVERGEDDKSSKI